MSARRWVERVGVATTATAMGLVATSLAVPSASADAPTKVAWWNTGAAPAPDAPAGGLHISVSSQQTTAFGAVDYALARDGAGTLTLSVAQMSGSNAAMLNAIEACPTTDDSWKAGDDQDIATAPKYDCNTHHFAGRLSGDGKTMTFLLDGSADVSDGVLSLAIVPVHTTGAPAVGTDTGTGADLTPPFVIDFSKPDAGAFVVTDPGTSAPAPAPAPVPAPAPAPATATTGTAPAAPAALPPAGSVNMPAGTVTGQSPVVAGQQPAAPTGFAPQAAVHPTSGSDTKRNLLLVLLVLLGFGALYTQQQTPRAPQSLLRARRTGPAAAAGATAEGAVAAAAPVPGAVQGFATPRGIGRFAKPRTGPARPLI